MPSRRAGIRMSGDEVAAFLDAPRTNQLRGVELVGSGRSVDDRDTVVAVGAALFRRYQADDPTGELTPAAREGIRAQAAKRTAVLVDVEDVVSWDHRKLGD